MNSQSTDSIIVTVMVDYDAKNSYPLKDHHVFKYHITIENNRTESITIRKRHWQIFDLGHGFTEISGDGVIGMMPEIKSGEQFNYFSNVVLISGVGYMYGYYEVWDHLTQKELKVEIPKFHLISEVLCN